MRNNKPSKRELLELKIEERRSKYNYINKKTDIVKKKIEPINFEIIFNDNKIEEINVQKEFKPITKPTRDERRCNTLDIVKKTEIVKTTNDEKIINISFDSMYNKEKRVDYDAIIIISSYNRYDSLVSLLKQLLEEETEYKIKIIVLDDGSTISYDLSGFNEIILLKNEVNYGKKLYWKSVNKLFNEASKFTTHCVIQIDDDFILTKNFITKSIKKFFYVKNKSNQYVAIRYHTSTNDKMSENRWGLGNNWIDGGTIFDINFLKKINFKIDEIPLKRWEINPMISSGVWWKISKIINTDKLLVYETTKSLAKHNGNAVSMMNYTLRKDNPINTINYDE